LVIACPQPEEFTLKLRLPGWVGAHPDVRVNGETQVVTGNPSSYAQIHRIWQNDTVELTLPHILSVSPLPDLPYTVAFMEGPVVLAGILGGGEKPIGAETLTEKTLYGSKDDPTTILIPDNEREFTRWRIGYRTSGQPVNIRFIPLYEVREESYAVYFPITEIFPWQP
jgi:DUF1680 family protein